MVTPAFTTPEKATHYHYSEHIVDTSSPFRSVKEAVAVYGERFLARKLVQPSPKPAPEIMNAAGKEQAADIGDHHNDVNCMHVLPICHGEAQDKKHNQIEKFQKVNDGDDDDCNDGDDDGGGSSDISNIVHHHMADYRHYDTLMSIFRKLETELQEAKMEIKSLKERESENEVALASLKAELHKCMSKIAKLEATEAANTKHALRSASFELGSSRETGRGLLEERKKDPKVTTKEGQQPTLLMSQILSLGDCEEYLMNAEKAAKRKPIIPLVTDIFTWKKKSPPPNDKDRLSLFSSLYSF